MNGIATKPPPLVPLGEGALEDYASDLSEKYVPSGVDPLDALILGAVAGELTLIAGNAGQGKTSLAMQWAINAAGNGIPAAILSMEMGRRALRNRLVSGLSGLPMAMLRTRKWASEKHRAKALEQAQFLNSLPLYVDDRGGLNGQQAYDTILSWGKQGVEIAFVDYIQQMGGTNESRVTVVGDAVRALKDAAKAADIPVVALSSLNRGAGQGTSTTPRLRDLRDSGDLEFVADTVIMLHYPEDDLLEDIRQCDLYVLKQRNGPTGVASVLFNKPATRFEER